MFRLVFLLALGGCAQSISDVPAVETDPSCDAGKAQSYIGKAATAELAEAARLSAGAEVIRWLRPGMAVTMEYRMGRLNISIDEKNLITSVDCG